MTTIEQALTQTALSAVEQIRVDLSPDGEWVPVALLGGPEIGVKVCSMVWNSREEKEVARVTLAELVGSSDPKPEAVVIVAPVWYVEREVEGDSAWDGRPSGEQADRREAMSVLTVTATDVRHSMADVDRHPHAPPTLSPWRETSRGASFDGDWVAALQPALRP